MGTTTKLLHEHNLQKSFMSSQKSSLRLSSKSVAITRKKVPTASVSHSVIKTRSNAKQQLQKQLTKEPIAIKSKPNKSTTKNSNVAASGTAAAAAAASTVVHRSMERGANKRNNAKCNNNSLNINNNEQRGDKNPNHYDNPVKLSNNINNNHDNNSINIDSTTTTTKATTKSKSKSNQKSNERKNQTKTARTKRKYLCHFCKKEFLGGNDLRKHIRIHTDERPFECTHCGQKFRQGGCLKNHIASQHGTTQTFTCYYCEKTFPIKERLRLHMRLHSGEKPYQCEICEKRFARGGQLTQHLATHNILKKHQCPKCPASFACSMSYKLHLKRHSNERDLTCHLCGKSFIRPDALKKHLTGFHENLKAFYCNICSRTFKGHLPQHMRTHENVKTFGCSMCGSFFSQKSQLIVHQRIHSGERPYRCQVCWHAFAHSSVLKLHIRKHTGEKPFKCMMCKDVHTAFSQLPHLKTHMRAIHGMDKTYNCEYCSVFLKTKHELQEHKITCAKTKGQSLTVEPDVRTDTSNELMSLSKMRLLIAVLLKKISTQARLKQLGFDKRLIDNVLIGALEIADQPICDDAELSEIDRLRKNVQQFLEWSLPDMYIKKFKKDQRSAEELLVELTSSFKPETKNASSK